LENLYKATGGEVQRKGKGRAAFHFVGQEGRGAEGREAKIRRQG